MQDGLTGFDLTLWYARKVGALEAAAFTIAGALKRYDEDHPALRYYREYCDQYDLPEYLHQ